MSLRSRIAIAAFMAALGVAVAFPGWAGEKDKAAKEAYEKIYDAVWNDDYAKAVKLSESFMKDHANSKWAEGAQYWRCYSIQRASHEYGKALECYKSFLEKHAQGKWADDARTEALKLAKRLDKAGDPAGKMWLQAFGDCCGDGENDEYLFALIYATLGGNEDGEVSIDNVRKVYNKLDSKPEARKRLVYMLQEVDNPDVVDLLVDIGKSDPVPEIRQSAVHSLIACGDDEARVAKGLAEIMSTEKNRDVRRQILYSLNEIDDPSVLPILVDAAVKSDDPEMAQVATYALSELDDERATKALRDVLGSTRNPETKRAALYALMDREDAGMVPLLKDIVLARDKDGKPVRGDHDLQTAAVFALISIEDKEHDDDVISVLQQVTRADVDPDLKRAAFYALAERGGKVAFETLREAALTSTDRDVAVTAVYSIAEMVDDDEAADVMFEIYSGAKHHDVREAALRVLIDVGGKNSVARLGEVLKREDSSEVRVSIVWTLAEVESDEAVGVLARVARKDPSSRVRTAAVRALSDIDTPAAKKALEDLLESEH